ISIIQDLLDPSHCLVVDTQSGADLSRQIRRDGILDAAAWLGLDRRSFAATAFVEQAYGLVNSAENSTGRGLQRAVATGGGGHTVTEALDRIQRHREQVIGDSGDLRSPVGQSVVRLGEAGTAYERVEILRQARDAAEQKQLAASRHAAALLNEVN